MLASFIIKRQFCRLGVALHVDCERREASCAVTYDRRIVHMSDKDPRFDAVRTPEMAEAWLSQDMGERGNLVEMLEWRYRTMQTVAA
jgi:hypothetical protein